MTVHSDDLAATADFDVVVVGGGVIGAAIARELSRYELRCALVEAADDVGTGTSKANTAIHHTGFDAKPGTLEAALLARSFPLMREYATRSGIPLQTTGALLVAWNPDQLAALDGIADGARRNGYHRARPVPHAELYAREPHLGAGALGALEIPDEGILCPFTTPLGLATEAVLNDVRLFLGARVTGVEREAFPRTLHTTRGPLTTEWVVNAAGLYADEVDRMFGHDEFTVTPRRGQLIVFDKLARTLVRHVLLPVPTPTTKGVLVAPTVFGNVLLGPTAEDLDDRTATQTTEDGLADLLGKGSTIVPALTTEEVTATYAGLRAATEHRDYQIRCHAGQRYVCVGGIRSTGLSSCLGIAAFVADLLADGGLKLRPTAEHRTVRMPNIGEDFLRPYQDEAAIASNPAYGEVICHCERVTRGEIVAAAGAPIPARTLDALRRRTRAMLGRCQGFYCTAEVADLLAHATGRPIRELLRADRRPEAQ